MWECTETVGEYLTTSDGSKCLIDDFRDSSVLDLGCGAGILGILAVQNGATVVHFQDYVRLFLPNFNRISFDLLKCFSICRTRLC